MSINDVRKLVDGNEGYPPSREVWSALLKLVKTKPINKKDVEVADLRDRMRREFGRYKPSLPEPELARFVFAGVCYYLDGKGQIYETDDDNPMVGNLVGEIKGKQVIIKGEEVYCLLGIDVTEQTMYDRKYYVADDESVYSGFHPKHGYIYLYGKLMRNEMGKLQPGKIDILI